MVSDFYAPEPVKPANHLPSPEASEGRREFTRIELGFFYQNRTRASGSLSEVIDYQRANLWGRGCFVRFSESTRQSREPDDVKER